MEKPAVRPYIRELLLFRVRQLMPLLFAGWERMEAELAPLVRLLAIVSFRYSVVSGLNPNVLEPTYHEAAKSVLDGSARGLAQVFARLAPIYVPDVKFEQDFAVLSFDTANQRKRLARYVLARLEHDASQRAVDPETDPSTLEHVLPENPQNEWADQFPRETWERAIYRLGNVTLLDAPTNRTIANAPYSDKVRAYRSSTYRLTSRIAELAPTEWTLPLLDARQREMAKRAVHVWRVDC